MCGSICSDSLLFSPRVRFHHEWLQANIVRIFGPASVSQSKQRGNLQPTDHDDAPDSFSVVRHIKMAYENVIVVDCLDLTPEGNAGWEAALERCVREGEFSARNLCSSCDLIYLFYTGIMIVLKSR